MILPGDRIQSVEATTLSVHRPTLAARATIEVSVCAGAGRQAPAHRGVDHGDRMRQRAEAVKAEPNEVRRAAKRVP